jgi:Zn-finger nucleic acid-binding protein
VWLDRGELDKIVERAGGPAPAPRDVRSADDRPERRDDRRGRSDDDFDDDFGDRSARGGRRRRGFLDDLFDFG